MKRGLGVALSEDHLVAHWQLAGRDGGSIEPWCRQLNALEGTQGSAELQAVLQELRCTVGRKMPQLHIALLPPLSRIRRIDLPRLEEEELRTVLLRGASRFLLDPPVTPVVSIFGVQNRARSSVPYVATFADEGLVESILAAAELAGWRDARVVSAYAAWEAGVRQQLPGVCARSGCLVIAGDTGAEALLFVEGRIASCRRFAVSVGPVRIVEQILEWEPDPRLPVPDRWYALLGSEPLRSLLASELLRRGVPSLLPPCAGLLATTPASLAASGVVSATSTAFLPEAKWLQRWHRERTRSRHLLTGAAAMLLLSAGLELWGTHREVAALKRERQAIAPLVRVAIEVRQTMQGIEERLSALAIAEKEASNWTGVIAGVATHLPLDAHLTGLHASGDSIVLDGVAARAAGVFEALRAAPGTAGIRAEAPTRQEVQDSGASVERFSLGARLAGVRPAMVRQP